MPDLLIRDLPGAIPESALNLRIEKEDLAWPEETLEDKAALMLVREDISKAEGFLVSRQYIRQWDLADRLFYAYVIPQNWPGTEVPRSSLGMPLLATHLFSILSTVMQSLYSGMKPFQVDPTASTTMATAQANQALLNWETERCGLKQELRMVAYDALLYGTGLGMYGYEPIIRLKKKKSWRTSANGKELAVDEDGEQLVLPKFEYVHIRHYLVDPGCRRGDVSTAKWFARRMYLSADELDELRDLEGFNIPARELLEALVVPDKEGPNMSPMEMGSFNATINLGRKALPRWMDTTADPLKQGFEVIEYWTPDRVIHMLERQFCIRNGTHKMGKVPARSSVFYEAPDSYYGVGLTHLIGNYQSVMQGVVNLYLDDLSLNLNGMFVARKGMNETGQAIWASPGKVVRVDDVAGFKPLERQPVGPDAMGMIEACQSWAQTASGASEISVQGSMPSNKSSITRTAYGAGMLDQGTRVRGENYIDQLADLVILPTLYAFMDINFEYLTPGQIKTILGEDLGHAYTEDPINLQNGSYKLTISAASRLQARQQLNQLLPTLVSLLTNPNISQGLQIEGKKVNWGRVLTSFVEPTGYPGFKEMIVPMTPEDLKRMEAMNPGMQKQQLQDAKIQGEANAQIQVEEAKAGGRALIAVTKHALEKDDQALGMTQ